MSEPLAERLRPRTLDNFIGQSHLVGANSILRNSLTTGIIPSMILWGPPGVGKTTLALILAKQLNRPFYILSAINLGVKDIREVLDKSLSNEGGSILFIDEIHRFNKSQQDSLLGAVEKGTVTLIGATTENPSFEVITPLLSRCQVYILKELEKEELEKLLNIAVAAECERLNKKINLIESEVLLLVSGGDARKLFNAFELLVNAEQGDIIDITNEKVLSLIQKNIAIYDKGGEQHYDVISAFIKSMRGSDPNAAVYWLARMIEGGEDPKFIARRMLILASEDIGNANPNALLLATSCFQAVSMIGYPECELILSQTAIYLSTSPKSNASITAIKSAQKKIKETGFLPVPLHLRNAPTKLMKNIGYGDGYKYAHSYEGNFISTDFLPEEIKGSIFFEPGNNKKERELRELLKLLWKDKYSY